MPTPRPRASRFGVYNPKKYTDYKKSLVTYLLSLNIPSKDYDYIHAKFYVSYPKSTPKNKNKNRFLIHSYSFKRTEDKDQTRAFFFLS